MASETGAGTKTDTDAILLGILAVLVDEREQRQGNVTPKTEVLLSDAGVPTGLIARAMNKQPDAVRMVLARARQGEARSRSTRGRKSTGVSSDA